MLVSLKHQFIFFSNPKCATTSIEEYISKYCEISITSTKLGKHIKPKKFKKLESLLKKECNIDNFTKICTARHPIDKIISWYIYRSRPGLKTRKPDRYLGNTDFRNFCAEKMQHSALNFFYEQKRNVYYVDYVVPIEHLARLERFFSITFGLSSKLPRKNTSKAIPKEDISDYREIAAVELRKASKDFVKSVEKYNEILDHYNNSQHQQIINITSIA